MIKKIELLLLPTTDTTGTNLVNGVVFVFVDLRRKTFRSTKRQKRLTFQNLNFHELDSIITRVGENSRIIFCGDASQSDLVKTNDRNGIHDFLNILRKMPSFDIIEFGIDDIVRSGLVKEYIISKLEVGL